MIPIQEIATWLVRLGAEPLTWWLAGSMLAYAATRNALWLVRSCVTRLHPIWGWLAQAFRFAFYLGVPYLALGGWPRPPFSGLLSPDDLGLVGTGPRWPAVRWLAAAGNGLGLGVVALLILLLAWWSANQGKGRPAPHAAGEADPGRPERLRFAPRQGWELLIDGLYLQVHWAFYRGTLTVILDDAYGATFLGLGAVYLEWLLDPFWRQGWRRPLQAAERWLRTALALVTATIFLLTRNLWVCLVVHWLTESVFWRLGCAVTEPESET